MFIAFPCYWLANEITLNFDSKFHDSYLSAYKIVLPKMIQYGENSP